jgi:glyoxylase-like metal-dependent hydrolase (beta-lactamase superfamily II)
MPKPFCQFTKNLWVFRSKMISYNSGIFLDNGQACLIDPGLLPDEVESIASFVEGQNAVPEWLVLTHHHYDHLLGAWRFSKAKTVTSTAYVEVLTTELRSRIRRQISSFEEEYHIERNQAFVIPRPDRTFKTSTIINLGLIQLQLIHAPCNPLGSRYAHRIRCAICHLRH